MEYQILGKFTVFTQHMKVLIIGATGFIGRQLMKELAKAGHTPVGVSRNSLKAREILGPEAEIAEWDGLSAQSLATRMEGMDAMVNLAGESVASGLWTERRKKIITGSRIETSRLMVEGIRLASARPGLILQGSAIGYYGSPVDEPADENNPPGKGFMAELTLDWESETMRANSLVNRIVILRTGLVLGKEQGILKKMLLPFRFGFGTVMGSGRQWMSWIHISDQVRAIRFLIENDKCSGAFNLTAPCPVSMNEFIRTTGKVLGKPVLMKVPGLFFKAGLGKMAEETILSSQYIIPAKLQREGFSFLFSNLEPALVNLLNPKQP
jgi:uncharacterized protein